MRRCSRSRRHGGSNGEVVVAGGLYIYSCLCVCDVELKKAEAAMLCVKMGREGKHGLHGHGRINKTEAE